MSIVFTSIARIKDWQALESLNNEILVNQAREAGATRYRVYRNVNDATQALVMIEFSSHSALYLLGDEHISRQLNALFEAGVSDDRVWELVNFDMIG